MRLTTAELTVRVVGEFTVCQAGTTLPATEVGSRKARTLLALLAVSSRYLSTDCIVSALWPDSIPRNPTQNIATLISRLRSVLGQEVFAGGRGGYRIGGHVRIDLYHAAGLVNQAEAGMAAGSQLDSVLDMANQAISLLEHGGVLDDQPEAPWAEPARAMHIELLRRARHVCAEAALQLGDITAARSAAHAAVSTDMFDETAYRMLMRAHYAAGEPAHALHAYQRLRTTLADELGIDPAAATRDLHQAILEDKPADPPALVGATPDPASP